MSAPTIQNTQLFKKVIIKTNLIICQYNLRSCLRCFCFLNVDISGLLAVDLHDSLLSLLSKALNYILTWYDEAYRYVLC